MLAVNWEEPFQSLAARATIYAASSAVILGGLADILPAMGAALAGLGAFMMSAVQAYVSYRRSVREDERQRLVLEVMQIEMAKLKESGFLDEPASTMCQQIELTIQDTESGKSQSPTIQDLSKALAELAKFDKR